MFVLHLIICLFFFNGPSSQAKVFSPVVGGGTTQVEVEPGVGLSKAKNGNGFSIGAVGYLDSKYEEIYYRLSALVEARKFYADTSSNSRRYDHLVVSFPVGIAYSVLDLFWPFVGVSLEWSARQKCYEGSGSCGEDDFLPLLVPVQVGIAFGEEKSFKGEIIVSQQLMKVSDQFKSYNSFLFLLHLYPE